MTDPSPTPPPPSTFDLTAAPSRPPSPTPSTTSSASDSNLGLDDRFIAEIMMNLDESKLTLLRLAFEAHDDDGLSLAEFVHVMTTIMGSTMGHFMTGSQFAANLIEFFDQVRKNIEGGGGKL